MNISLRAESLQFNTLNTYLLASIFIIGNLLLPQICHLVPQGGHIWLPIYFFTLVGAYCFGWRVGLLTAVASPLINSALFGMPAVAVLPAILIKSVILAVLAGLVATRYAKPSFWVLLCVVLGYQITGTLGEWAIVGDFAAATSDFKLGIPGMALQIIAGKMVIDKIKKS